MLKFLVLKNFRSSNRLDARAVPAGRGAASTVAWLRGVLLIGAGAAARMLRLAVGLRSAPATASQVLDLGRQRRPFTGAIRLALTPRDGGCAFPGCDGPPTRCHAHHLTSWLDGGPTDLHNGVLLRAHHHRLVHQHEWEVRLGPDRLPEFLPPARLDPDRTPRRNQRLRAEP